jgi:hypothetical protein
MEANWRPLEARLGALWCVGFMFMGRLDGVNQYKHGISRRHLFLDDEGWAYESAGRDEFREIAFEEALGRAEEPLGALGATLETRYEAAFIRTH